MPKPLRDEQVIAEVSVDLKIKCPNCTEHFLLSENEEFMQHFMESMKKIFEASKGYRQ